jgi:hypothetical protein
MAQRGFFVFGSLLLVAGCGGSRVDPEPERAPEVAVVVSSSLVEVHVQHTGGCREVTAFPGTDSCETFGWAVAGVETAVLTPICRPKPTCVTEIRLERDGEVLAAVPGPSVGFSADIAGLGGRVVLSGCGDPITVELPPPLTDEVKFDINAEGETLHVGASGPSVRGVLARAVGVIPFPRSFKSACRSEGAPLELPRSGDFSNYLITSFALGEPIVSAGGAVRTFPAQSHAQFVSTFTELGPAWAAAVLLAKQSSLYPTCDAYCAGWSEGCGLGVDTEQCAVLCVTTGSLYPSCRDEWQTLLQCRQYAGSCDERSVTSYSEDPFKVTTSSEPTRCPDQQLAYDRCSGADTQETPAE